MVLPALTQTLLGVLTDPAAPRVISSAPVENFLQGAAATEALLVLV